jgi:hypothetical protein
MEPLGRPQKLDMAASNTLCVAGGAPNLLRRVMDSFSG